MRPQLPVLASLMALGAGAVWSFGAILAKAFDDARIQARRPRGPVPLVVAPAEVV